MRLEANEWASRYNKMRLYYITIWNHVIVKLRRGQIRGNIRPMLRGDKRETHTNNVNLILPRR